MAEVEDADEEEEVEEALDVLLLLLLLELWLPWLPPIDPSLVLEVEFDADVKGDELIVTTDDEVDIQFETKFELQLVTVLLIVDEDADELLTDASGSR